MEALKESDCSDICSDYLENQKCIYTFWKIEICCNSLKNIFTTTTTTTTTSCTQTDLGV